MASSRHDRRRRHRFDRRLSQTYMYGRGITEIGPEMHILLTDLLSCPRCGPDFGLILLADRIVERRVLDGRLGCANCRERYPITGGYGELASGLPGPAHVPPNAEPARPGGGAPAAAGTASAKSNAADSDEPALRLAALLGVTDGPGFVLLVGAPATHAVALAGMVPGLEVVAAADEARAWEERAGVSRIGVAGRLPFYNRQLRGIVLSGTGRGELLEEAVRALGPLARLVLLDAPPDAAESVRALGLTVLAQQGDTLVAARG